MPQKESNIGESRARLMAILTTSYSSEVHLIGDLAQVDGVRAFAMKTAREGGSEMRSGVTLGSCSCRANAYAEIDVATERLVRCLSDCFPEL